MFLLQSFSWRASAAPREGPVVGARLARTAAGRRHAPNQRASTPALPPTFCSTLPPPARPPPPRRRGARSGSRVRVGMCSSGPAQFFPGAGPVSGTI
eukprot:scaffold3347_cov382-Prasinococcus_capsulatus_cf.AAC.1